MAKRTSVKKIKRRHRARNKLLIGAMFTAFLAGSGWWIFFSGSDSKLRMSMLSNFSTVVDRIDELSKAWKDRSFPEPGANEVKTGLKSPADAKVASPSVQTQSRPAVNQKPGKALDHQAPPKRPDMTDPKPRPTEPAIKPPAVDYVTEDDQDELDQLFKHL